MAIPFGTKGPVVATEVPAQVQELELLPQEHEVMEPTPLELDPDESVLKKRLRRLVTEVAVTLVEFTKVTFDRLAVPEFDNREYDENTDIYYTQKNYTNLFLYNILFINSNEPNNNAHSKL